MPATKRSISGKYPYARPAARGHRRNSIDIKSSPNRLRATIRFEVKEKFAIKHKPARMQRLSLWSDIDALVGQRSSCAPPLRCSRSFGDAPVRQQEREFLTGPLDSIG